MLKAACALFSFFILSGNVASAVYQGIDLRNYANMYPSASDGNASNLYFSAAIVVVLSEDRSRAVGACSGTYIAKDIILTAAHCVAVDKKGVPTLSFGNGMKALKAIKYPKNRKDKNESVDLALILLDGNAPRVIPAILATEEVTMSDEIVLTGSGKNGDDEEFGKKFLVTKLADIYWSSRRVITLGSGLMCSGDSGGGVFVRKGDNVSLVGVNSYTTGSTVCGESNEATSESVFHHRQWILDTVKKLRK